MQPTDPTRPTDSQRPTDPLQPTDPQRPARARRARRARLRTLVDVLLAVTLVMTQACALVAEAPHEYLGAALVALLGVHAWLGRRWFATLSRRRWTALRVARAVAVAGLLLCVAGQVASAAVLSRHLLNALPAIPGAAWARRVHLLCSYWCFVLAFVHAGLQVRWPLAVRGSRGATWALRVGLAVVVVLGALAAARLRLPAYLSARVQFAQAEPNVALGALLWALAAATIAIATRCACVLGTRVASPRSQEGRAA